MQAKGFTLLELLTTVTIAVILLGVGVPGMASLIDKARADNSALSIYRGFQFARATAITTQRTLTVCGSHDGSTCSREWGRYLLIFADQNDNKISEPDELIRQEALDFDEHRITTSMSFGKTYTRIKPDGVTSFQGSMVYCTAGKLTSSSIICAGLGITHPGMTEGRHREISRNRGLSRPGQRALPPENPLSGRHHRCDL